MRKPGKGPISDAPTPKGGGARQRVAEFAIQRGIDLPESLPILKKDSKPQKAVKKTAAKRKKPATD